MGTLSVGLCVAAGSAAEEVASILDLPPDFRISTVTGWLADLDARTRDSASRHG